MIKVLALAFATSMVASVASADKWSDQFPHIKNTGDIQVSVLMSRCPKKITAEEN